MRLDQALQKIGVEVVKVDPSGTQLTLLLRVHKNDPLYMKRWTFAASQLVKASASAQRAGMWSADVSKALVLSNGGVVFFWRVILNGNIKTGQRIFGEAVLEALRQGAEIKTMPLVGQVTYPRDAASGKLKGGHATGTAEGIIAAHFTVR